MATSRSYFGGFKFNLSLHLCTYSLYVCISSSNEIAYLCRLVQTSNVSTSKKKHYEIQSIFLNLNAYGLDVLFRIINSSNCRDVDIKYIPLKLFSVVL